MALQKMIKHCTSNGIAPEIAHQNYLLFHDLNEVHTYWDLSWGSKESMMYCAARTTKDGPISIFIPTSSCRKTSIQEIEKLQSLFESHSIVLAIQSPDSSSVFYEVTNGLVRSTTEKPKKEYHESFLRNNRKFLLSQAEANESVRDAEEKNLREPPMT